MPRRMNQVLSIARPIAGDIYDAAVGRAVLRALYAEVALHPKPGLVSFRDSGSHRDMDGRTFLRSIGALRDYFPRIARAGREDQPFEQLKQLGLAAEAAMLQATGGVNTHRGAIFCLGLLCAAAGRLHDTGSAASASALRQQLLTNWGAELRLHAARRELPLKRMWHHARPAGVISAAEEAARGMPTLFERVLPALRSARAQGLDREAAAVQALSRRWQYLTTPTSSTAAVGQDSSSPAKPPATSLPGGAYVSPTGAAACSACTSASSKGVFPPVARPICWRQHSGSTPSRRLIRSKAVATRPASRDLGRHLPRSGLDRSGRFALGR